MRWISAEQPSGWAEVSLCSQRARLRRPGFGPSHRSQPWAPSAVLSHCWESTCHTHISQNLGKVTSLSAGFWDMNKSIFRVCKDHSSGPIHLRFHKFKPFPFGCLDKSPDDGLCCTVWCHLLCDRGPQGGSAGQTTHSQHSGQKDRPQNPR